jgi:hypothetical protein
MRDGQYQGGFDHPLRAFLIGVTLLVLLFGGFVVGVEAGTNPRSVAVSTIEVSGTAGTRVVTQKVNSRVITVQGKVVTLPGTNTTKVVKVIVVRDRRGRVHYYLQPASTSSSGEPLAAASTVVLTGSPITITAPPTTVIQTETAPGTTVTETVTETAPPTTTDTSNATTTTP